MKMHNFLGQDRNNLLYIILYWNRLYHQNLPDRESNPGLPRDRRGYSPLYYRGYLFEIKTVIYTTFPYYHSNLIFAFLRRWYAERSMRNNQSNHYEITENNFSKYSCEGIKRFTLKIWTTALTNFTWRNNSDTRNAMHVSSIDFMMIHSICFKYWLLYLKVETYFVITWPVGLVVWFSLRVREVPGSTPGQAPFKKNKWKQLSLMGTV